MAAGAHRAAGPFVSRFYAKSPFVWNLDGLKVDLTRSWLQWYAHAFEEHYFFVHLMERWARSKGGSKKFIWVGSYLNISKQDRAGFLPAAGLVTHLEIPAWVDRAWQWTLAGMHLIYWGGRMVVGIGTTSAPKRTYRYLWAGISQAEAATVEGRLDFAFLVERGLIRPEECLYILPSVPSPEAQQYMAKRGIHWTTHRSSPLWVTRWERWRGAGQMMVTFVRSIVRREDRFALPVLLQYAFRMHPWIPMTRTLKPQVYLSTVSSCWPENAEIAVMNALGVRTINWSYGANAFGYSQSNDKFQDLGVLRSVAVSREIWVWHEAVANLLESRRILPGKAASAIRLTGPVMCGDSRILGQRASEVRLLHGIETHSDAQYISVFDVPPADRQIRLASGFGPNYYPLAMLEKFFEDILEVLDRFASVHIIVKPKRAINDPTIRRDFPQSMLKLVAPDGEYRRQGRVILLEPDIDPYIPVAMADICLGVPFTSPVMAGLSGGRMGIYHDPLSSVLHFAPKAMAPLVTHGRDELIARLGDILRDGRGIERVGPDAEAYMGPAGDPAVRFANMLKDATYA